MKTLSLTLAMGLIILGLSAWPSVAQYTSTPSDSSVFMSQCVTVPNESTRHTPPRHLMNEHRSTSARHPPLNCTPRPEALRTDANKVRGCVSQVWLASAVKRAGNGAAPVLEFQGDSDAHIVRGLVAVLFALVQGKTPQEVLGADAKALFAELGLTEHLTPQRSNGFFSMVERIRADARAAAA